MELIELDATAQRALELLTNAGMSDGSIYDYTHTGFGSILRHFHTKSILYATAEMLDNFLLEQRALLDQGDISQWKWGLVRRSCELLKQCRLCYSEVFAGNALYYRVCSDYFGITISSA